jgi:AcrR family transcriptional regulator
MGDVSNKSWAGSTLADRQAARHKTLIAAGLTLLARGGGPAMTVRAVCRQAALTERYFYESFRDRDEMAAAVFDHVAEDVVTRIVDAVASSDQTARGIATAAVDAVVALAVDEPDKGRVLFVASMTDPLLYRKRDAMVPVVTGLIREQLARLDTAHQELVAASLVGALGNLFYQYVAGTLDVSRDALVDHCVELLLTTAAMPAQARPVSR